MIVIHSGGWVITIEPNPVYGNVVSLYDVLFELIRLTNPTVILPPFESPAVDLSYSFEGELITID